MLTSKQRIAKFPLAMLNKRKRLLFIFMLGLVLQSCYTVLRPPESTLNQLPSNTGRAAVGSSLMGSSMYGWDPYWEPILPYNNYNRGYGSSYYSPYNYYDYQHPYYSPVYIYDEDTPPMTGRNYNRDSKGNSERTRTPKVPSTTLEQTVVSSTGPVIGSPVSKKPVISSSPKSSSSKAKRARVVNRSTPRVKKEKTTSTKTETKDSETEAPKKRKRTKK